MQEAIDYCKNPLHRVEAFIVKSIDRFTRGGSYSYSNLKMQLDDAGVRLMDIYGIIGTQKVNTLEHLGVSYKWSVYDPTKNSEILEAERASDEKRDIMSRMIGAQIRYARLGYWVRKAPVGFENVTAETMHGRRCVLEPHPVECLWMQKMFELRCRGNVSDAEIVEQINRLGFKTKTMFVRSVSDSTRIVAKKGGNKLTVRSLWRYLQNPVYAGVNAEAWIQDGPIKCKFAGLVSIETFNKANRGRIRIIDDANGLRIDVIRRTISSSRHLRPNELYPYRSVVLCPQCRLPLVGSAARGHSGKVYPAYHCNKRMPKHYFRVPKPKFDATIEGLTERIGISPKYKQQIIEAVQARWRLYQAEVARDNQAQDIYIKELKDQARLAIEKIRFLSSQTSIKYIEEGVIEIEREVEMLEAARQARAHKYSAHDNIGALIEPFLDDPCKLLFLQPDTAQRIYYFGLLFEALPTYSELAAAVSDDCAPPSLSSLFSWSAG